MDAGWLVKPFDTCAMNEWKMYMETYEYDDAGINDRMWYVQEDPTIFKLKENPKWLS